MASRTKIFISSSAQLALKKPRETLFDFLEKLGHEPLRYEENFGAWTNHTNGVAKCLEMVRESDLLVLLISTKAGTYLPEDDATVTYLEFLEAIKNQKTTLIFVKDDISDAFFGKVKPLINDAVTTYRETHNRKPRSIYKDILMPMQSLLPAGVDSYTWAFLLDVVERNIYFEQYSEGVDLTEKLGMALSDLLRKGNQLLPYETLISQLPDPERQDEYHELQGQFFREMHIERLDKEQWMRIMPLLRDKMRKGGVISQQRGTFYAEPIVNYRGCSAVSLYVRDGNLMELVAKDGILSGNEFYHLDQDKESSYIVQTYLANDGMVQIWYRESKKTVYFLFRVNEYVMCLHFVLEKRLPHSKVEMHTEDFIYAIMEEQGDIISLVQLVLGGMKDGNP